MFGNNWSYNVNRNAPSGSHAPRFFPPPLSGQRAMIPDLFRPMPPPPHHPAHRPPQFHPSHSYQNLVACAPPPPPPPAPPLVPTRKGKFGYNVEKPPLSNMYSFEMASRPSTDTPIMNEQSWIELSTKIKNSMSFPMQTAVKQLEEMNRKEQVISDVKEVIPDAWSPNSEPDLRQAMFPRKGDCCRGDFMTNDDAVTVESTSAPYRERILPAEHGRSVTIVNNSRKLIRKHHGVENGKVVKAAVQHVNKTKAAEASETATSTACENEASTSVSEEAVEVMIGDSTLESSSDSPSPPSSPARVVVMRNDEIVCETRSPVRPQKSPVPIRVTSVVKPSYSKTGRGAMSLRVINGHRITGNSRECFANLNGNCVAGPFCRFEHNGSRAHCDTRICFRLLRGLCRPDNPDCPFNHSTLLPHQYPICSFFLRGDCTMNEECKLLHVRHSPSVQVCEDFLRGVCLDGDECDFPHTYPYEICKAKGTAPNQTPPINPTPQNEEKAEKSTLLWIE